MNPIYKFGISDGNLFNSYGVEYGKAISASTGQSYDYSGYNATGYVDIGGCFAIEISAIYDGAFYDENQTFLSGIASRAGATGVIMVPDNAKYVRLSVAVARWETYSVIGNIRCYPNYKDDLAIDYALEQNQEFYRGKLSGKLTFQRDDYEFIRSKAFETQFGVSFFISYDGGQSWTKYWSGQFWKTDCKFNEDDQTAIVTPNVNDRYNAVLAGMNKEYNLIDLAPVIQPVKLDKRPMIQVYVPGQTVIGCFLSGMWWEQECDAVNDESALENTYHFSKNKTARIVEVTQQGTPVIPEMYFGEPYSGTGTTDYVKGAYKFEHIYVSQSGGAAEYFRIIRVSDGQLMWWVGFVNQAPKTYPIELTLNPVDGSGATGDIKLYIHDVSVFARYVTDVEQALGLNTYPIPDDDIVENNRNYHYVIGYYFPNTIWISDYLTTTPTKWGIYQPGLYYDAGIPASVGYGDAYPIARAAWSRISFWFVFDVFDWISEQYWRKEYTLKDAFPIWSVISVLLAKVAPGITHDGTTDYSQFLYDTNPIANIDQRLFITQKSNLIASGYDQPAQKAPIPLRVTICCVKSIPTTGCPVYVPPRIKYDICSIRNRFCSSMNQ